MKTTKEGRERMRAYILAGNQQVNTEWFLNLLDDFAGLEALRDVVDLFLADCPCCDAGLPADCTCAGRDGSILLEAMMNLEEPTT
jgi:hypothetical protein